jgi:hypothetical protein
MQHLEGSGTPVLYIGRTVPKRLNKSTSMCEYIWLGRRHRTSDLAGWHNLLDGNVGEL